jgi:hypothetical protein
LLREVARDVLGTMSRAVEAVLAVHLSQVHMSVLTKEADSVQDSPTSISIPMKCYLSINMIKQLTSNTSIFFYCV